jgi:hypothetical protein
MASSSRRTLKLVGIGILVALCGGMVSLIADDNPRHPLAVLSSAILAIGLAIIWYSVLRGWWWTAKAKVARKHERI